jgi:hypothetical protein
MIMEGEWKKTSRLNLFQCNPNIQDLFWKNGGKIYEKPSKNTKLVACELNRRHQQTINALRRSKKDEKIQETKEKAEED